MKRRFHDSNSSTKSNEIKPELNISKRPLVETFFLFAKHTFCSWLVVILFCEGLLFYLFAYECELRFFSNILRKSDVGSGFRVLLIADPHFLGNHRRQWIDIMWSDWGIIKALLFARMVHNPEIVLLAGDVFDEGSFCPEYQFDAAVERLKHVFGNFQSYVVPGNHDIGLMGTIWTNRLNKFENFFGSSNRMVCYKNVSILTYNTMVLGPHSNKILKDDTIAFITSYNTQEAISVCSGNVGPVVVQHIPNFRESDEACGTPADACEIEAHEATPGYCRTAGSGTTYKSRAEGLEVWHDVLDPAASALVLSALRPRLIVAGHLHAPCRRKVRWNGQLHGVGAAEEVTLPPLGWRMRPDAGYGVAWLSAGVDRDGAVVELCGLPHEHAVLGVYAATLVVTLVTWAACLARRSCHGGLG